MTRLSGLCRYVHSSVVVHSEHVVAVLVEHFARRNLFNHPFHNSLPFLLLFVIQSFCVSSVGCSFTSVILNLRVLTVQR